MNKLSREQVCEISDKALGNLSTLSAEKFAEEWPQINSELAPLNLHPSIIKAIEMVAKTAHSLGFIEGVRHGHNAGAIALTELTKAVDEAIEKGGPGGD